MYFGNTPELSLSQSEDTLDHYSSEGGLRVKDASVTLQADSTGSFNCDNISSENLALWFRGMVLDSVQVAAPGLTETFPAMKLGRHIQLGRNEGRPMGARKATVTSVSVDGGVTPLAVGNYIVDSDLGRVFLRFDAPDIDDGDDVTVEYDLAVNTEEVIISKGTAISGSLRFIADNPEGDNRDFFWAYVRLTPDGDFSLKGDDWQNATFNIEILKLNELTERQYITKRAPAG